MNLRVWHIDSGEAYANHNHEPRGKIGHINPSSEGSGSHSKPTNCGLVIIRFLPRTRPDPSLHVISVVNQGPLVALFVNPVLSAFRISLTQIYAKTRQKPGESTHRPSSRETTLWESGARYRDIALKRFVRDLFLRFFFRLVPDSLPSVIYSIIIFLLDCVCRRDKNAKSPGLGLSVHYVFKWNSIPEKETFFILALIFINISANRFKSPPGDSITFGVADLIISALVEF